MSSEQEVGSDLIKAFPFLQDKVRTPRARRIFVDIPADRFAEVFKYLYDKAGFTILCTITGLDQGSTLGVLYHLAHESGTVLTAGIAVPKEAPVIQTVTRTFPAADAYEREMVDLLGVQVEGLAPGRRYPLPDNWPTDEHPLRKDWRPAKEEPVSAESKEPKNAQ
jgi:membrane-bound hydrogenase subunit beta